MRFPQSSAKVHLWTLFFYHRIVTRTTLAPKLNCIPRGPASSRFWAQKSPAPSQALLLASSLLSYYFLEPFFAAFLADFFADFLAGAFFAAFLADFLAGAFFAAFFAVFFAAN